MGVGGVCGFSLFETGSLYLSVALTRSVYLSISVDVTIYLSIFISISPDSPPPLLFFTPSISSVSTPFLILSPFTSSSFLL